ncbi:hypothetical protein COCCADRAFT_101914, partial [Bipolaris zeicola 26-R-13]
KLAALKLGGFDPCLARFGGPTMATWWRWRCTALRCTACKIDPANGPGHIQLR